jgi:hypothetical protein
VSSSTSWVSLGRGLAPGFAALPQGRHRHGGGGHGSGGCWSECK